MNLDARLILFIVYCLGVGVLLGVKSRAKGARLRQGLLQLTWLLLVFGIILFVEMFSLFKFYKRWDLTENERFTFAPMTVNLLESLDAPLVATAFVGTTENRARYEQLLSIAYYYNPDNIRYEFADPERDLVKASQFPQPVQPPVLFLQYQDRLETVPSFSEEDLARALAKLTRGKTKAVSLLQGHGEHGLERGEGLAGTSYSALEALLDGQNKKIEAFSIDPEQLAIPDDCDVLLVAGPEIDLATFEYAALDQFLMGGGKLIVLLDNDKAPGVAKWLDRYGLVLPNDLLIEMTQDYTFTAEGIQPQITLNLAPTVTLREHEIAQGLLDKEKKIFAIEARSVALKEELPEGLTGTILADTLTNSWAESSPDYNDLESAEFDEGIEMEGPVPWGAIVEGDFASALGVASSTDAATGALVVFGDSDFPSDRTYGRSYGVNLLSNVINYLTEDKEMISIPPKTERDRPFVRMTGRRWATLLLGSLIVLPGAVFMIGLAVFLRRRRTG